MPRLENSKPRGGGEFVYRKRNPNTIYALAKRQGGNSAQPFKKEYPIWRPQPGPNTVRILPPDQDAEHYALTIYVHRFIGANNDNFLCINRHGGKRCPCCDASQEAREAGETEDAYSLSAREQRVAWILDRKSKENKKPQLYMYPWKMDQQIAEQIGDEDAGKVIWIDDPATGRDIRVRKSGNGMTTTYIPALAAEPSPIADRSKDYDAILDYVGKNPLPDVLYSYTAKEMEAALSGRAETKDSLDEDMDDKPRSRRGNGKARDEDEADERPRRTRARDEDEADERPARRRARDEEDDDPRGSRRRSESDDDGEERGSRRTRARDEPEDDERPARRRARDEEDDAPRGRRTRARAEDDEVAEDEVSDDHGHEDDEARSDRRTRARDEPEDDERPARRRAAAEDEDEPRGRRRARDEEDDEIPFEGRRPSEAEDDDEEKPRRRARADEDDGRRTRGPSARETSRNRERNR